MPHVILKTVIDLHTHTTHSDGTLAPRAVVALAKEVGLTAVAITDHDTMAGVPEALAEGIRAGIEVVPGVELSLACATGSLHLIGLFVDPGSPALLAALARVVEGRRNRNCEIVERLARLGVPVSIEEVCANAGGEVVARPHFARALVRRGYVGTMKEAFDRFLARGGPAYVDRYRLPVEESIRLLRGAGGRAVLCHPHTLGLGEGEALEGFVGGLKGLGLDAIEAWYPDYDARQEALYRALAERLGLLLSGGSDFHGPGVSEVRLGRGRGGLAVPDGALDALRPAR